MQNIKIQRLKKHTKLHCRFLTKGNEMNFKNAVTFNYMTERWETPPDDEEVERHDNQCRCRDCEMASAEAYYDAKREDEYLYD